jgi:hypothetical protein
MQYTLEIYSDLHGISSARRWSIRALKCVILLALYTFWFLMWIHQFLVCWFYAVLCFLLFGFRVVRPCAVFNILPNTTYYPLFSHGGDGGSTYFLFSLVGINTPIKSFFHPTEDTGGRRHPITDHRSPIFATSNQQNNKLTISIICYRFHIDPILNHFHPHG